MPTTTDLKADPEAAGFDPARLARIDEHLRTRYIEPGKIAGCQVLVSRAGRLAHAATLGLVADRPDDSASPEYRDWLRALGARVGQLPLEPYPGGSLFPLWRDYATEAHTAGVRMEAGRLEIARSTFGRFSTGGLQLLAYLLEAGCTDMRIGLVDFDAVRGD